MPWTPAVVDLRICLLPDRQDVCAPFHSRRLASMQTVRAEVTLSVHLYKRHMAATMTCVRLAPRRECQLAAASVRACSCLFASQAQTDAWLNTCVPDVRTKREWGALMPDSDSYLICRSPLALSKESE